MKKLFMVALLAMTVTTLFSCGDGGKTSQSGAPGNTWTVQFMLNNDTEDVYKEIKNKR